jgi:adenosylhomocysteine nucleosidase
MIGIIAAMPQEIAHIQASMKVTSTKKVGNREFLTGTINNKDVTVVLARIGKVAASTTATTLINLFNVSAVILTGVAGGIHPEVKIGDIVVGTNFIQHDMDASESKMFKKFEIPLLGTDKIHADDSLINKATISSKEVLKKMFPENSVHVGLMGAGDQFIASKVKVDSLRKEIPDLLCVEMEGAAAAQVCFEFGVPFVSIRSISDNANDDAATDFMKFVEEHAAPVSNAIVQSLLN